MKGLVGLLIRKNRTEAHPDNELVCPTEDFHHTVKQAERAVDTASVRGANPCAADDAKNACTQDTLVLHGWKYPANDVRYAKLQYWQC